MVIKNLQKFSMSWFELGTTDLNQRFRQIHTVYASNYFDKYAYNFVYLAQMQPLMHVDTKYTRDFFTLS